MSIIKVSDLSIIITGGARGIGAATAQLLAAQDARIVLTDVLDDEGQSLLTSSD